MAGPTAIPIIAVMGGMAFISARGIIGRAGMDNAGGGMTRTLRVGHSGWTVTGGGQLPAA